VPQCEVYGVVMSNSKKRNAAAIARLADAFPATFFVGPARRAPLRIGIADDIAATGIVSLKELRYALISYCSGAGYLRSLKAGAPRLDLAGNEVSIVTAEEAEHAREKLDAVLARRKPKPAPQQQAAVDAQRYDEAKKKVVLEKVQPQAERHAAADPDRVIAAAIGIALNTAAEVRKQKPAAAEPVRQPKGDGFAALKAAAARRKAVGLRAAR
jgi:sRNA-binding protein